MSIQELYKKEFGAKAWEKLSPRLKKLFLSTDSLPLAQTPVTPKQLATALR